MRTRDDLERWRNFGFIMTPSDPETKAPITKDGKHCFDWSDDQLEIARRLAFFHKESGVYTIDFEITEGEVTQIFEGDSAKFRVE